MKREKSIFEEIREFLDYIIKNERGKKRTGWEFLKRKLGEKKYRWVYDYCVERGYIGSLPYLEGKEKGYYIYIKQNGIGFLEEEKRREDREKLEALKIKTQKNATHWQIIHSIAFIILTVLIICTTYYFNTHPQPYKPDIHLSTNYENNEIPFSSKLDSVDFLLYIYNQGSGACIDMRLNHTGLFLPSLRPQKTFRQYTDVRDEIKDNFNSSTFMSSDNIWRMGTLDGNEVIVVDIRRRHDKLQLPDEMKIGVSCSNKETEFIIIRNKNPFIVKDPLP